MLRSQTVDQLRELRLYGFLSQWELISSNPSMKPDSYDEFLGMLTDAEVLDRSERKIKNLRRRARLKHPDACIENIDYVANRMLDREVINSLVNCAWIDRYQNVIFTGKTGLGKSWLSCLLGNEAIKRHKTVLYIRHSRLHEEIDLAKGEGTISSYRAKLSKSNLLIIDDWGLSPMTMKGRNDFLDVLEDKVGTGSVIISSQLPVSSWHDYIGDATIADAILDRLVHNTHKINLDGDTLRAKYGLKGGEK